MLSCGKPVRHNNLGKTMDSMSLSITDKREIGLGFLGSDGFGIQCMMALFHMMGNLPSAQERLNRRSKRILKEDEVCLMSLNTKPSSPGAEFFFGSSAAHNSKIEKSLSVSLSGKYMLH